MFRNTALILTLLLSVPSLSLGQGLNEAIYGRNLPTCTGSDVLTSNGTTLICVTPSGSVPAGLITLVYTGSCAAGWTEVTELNGITVIGTLAANKDVGTTGGNDNITPAGTNSALTFTGSSASTNGVSAGTPAGTINSLSFTGNAWSAPTISWPAGVPTHSGTTASFTGNASTVVVNHLHTLATGTTATGNFSQVIGTVDTTSGGTGGTPTQTALGTLSGNPTAGGAANYTPAGSISITSQGTIAWPAGVPTIGSYTPTGSITAPTFTGSALGTHSHTVTATGTINTPTFTGTQFDNRSAYIKVIFCKKT